MAAPASQRTETPAPVPARLVLRPLQKAIKDDTSRFKTACIHRRFGKTILAVDWLVEGNEVCTLPDYKGFFVFPFAKQGEEVAWDFLCQQTAHIPDCKYDKWRLEVTFPLNKARGDIVGGKIKLLGAEQYHKHRGKYADRVAFDELCDIPPAAWRQVFRPMLSDREGSAFFIGTPRGKDWFYDLWQNGGRIAGWKSWHANVYETGALPPAEIEALREEYRNDPNDFAREFLCDWDVAASGAYYQKQVNAMIDKNRIGEVPHLPDQQVYTSWHFDKNDTYTVLFWQQARAMWHAIDCLQEHNSSVAEIAPQILAKPYVYATHMCPPLPPDSARLQIARQLGLRMQPVRKCEHADVVELVKNEFPRFRFDKENCQDLTEAGRQYHAEYDEKLKVYKPNPVMNWAADYAGALGTFVLGPKRASDWNKPIVYPERFRA